MTKNNIKNYENKNPKKAKLIKKTINKGVKQYEETFRRLAGT